MGKGAETVKINLSSFKNYAAFAEQSVLSGSEDAENTLENPENIFPVNSTLKVAKIFEHLSPAISLTVIRIKKQSLKL